MQNAKYNTLMPESDETTLCFMVDKPISKEGYTENFLSRAVEIINQHGFFNILIYYKEFKGWEVEATKFDMEAMLQYGSKLRKMAVVNPPEKEIYKTKMTQPLLKGEIKFFESADLEKALEWVKS